MKTASFNSFQGFKELIVNHTQLPSKISELISFLGENPIIREEHNKVYLIDTFFSDSFPSDQLIQLFEKVLTQGLSVKLLIINPFSELGVLRGNALEQNRFEHINIALFKILEALLLVLKKRTILSKYKLEFEKNKIDSNYTFKLLDLVNSTAKNTVDLSIKFYQEFIDVPYYMIGPFIIKGLMLFKSSARINPWMIFIDDYTQENDLYDNLVKNFTNIWENSLCKPKENRLSPIKGSNVFLSHGHNDYYKDLVLKLINELNYKAITFEDKSIIGNSNLVNLESITQSCGSCISILSKDDQTSEGSFRARQNVIHELGFCQGAFGKNKVLYLIEDDVEEPSNISGINGCHFNEKNILKLKKHIKNFIESTHQS